MLIRYLPNWIIVLLLMIRPIFMRLIVRQHSCCYSVSSIYRIITIMFSVYFIQRRTRNLYELGSDPLYICIQWNMFISSLTFLLPIHFVNTSDYDSVSFQSVLLYTIENFYHSWNLVDGLAKYCIRSYNISLFKADSKWPTVLKPFPF